MPLSSSAQADLVELGRELLTHGQDATGWLCTKTRNVVEYSDPAIRARVQKDLDHSVALVSIAHLMAAVEQRFPETYWSVVLDKDDVELLEALRHVRHCAANGFTGLRPEPDRAAFDSVMADRPLQGVLVSEPTRLLLTTDIVFDASRLLRAVVDRAVVAAHSP